MAHMKTPLKRGIGILVTVTSALGLGVGIAAVSSVTSSPVAQAATTADANASIITASTTPTTSPVTFQAGDAAGATLTVTVKNAAGSLATTGGDIVTITPQFGTVTTPIDNKNGTYTATLTSKVAGSDTVSFAVNGVTSTNSVVVKVTPAPLSVANSTIAAGYGNLLVGGISGTSANPPTNSQYTLITVTLRDQYGNALGSNDSGTESINITTTNGLLDSGVSTVPQSLSTTVPATPGVATPGTYVATLFSGAAPGSATLAFTVGNAAATNQAHVTFATVAGATISASPVKIPADGKSTSTITVQAVDSNGNNALSSVGPVQITTSAGTLSAVQSGGTVATGPTVAATDNNNGTYTATLTSTTTVQAATLAFTLNGSPVANSTTVNFVADATALTAPATATVALGGTWTPQFTAVDKVGTAVTASGTAAASNEYVNVNGTVNTAVAGPYTITYTMLDALGNTVTAKSVVTVGTPVCSNGHSNVGIVGATNVRIASNGSLNMGTSTGSYTVAYAANGVLQVVDNTGAVKWSQNGGAGSWLSIQADGNLVLYRADGSVAWASNTRFHNGGNGEGGYLAIQCDGNFVLYGNNGTNVVPTWSSITGAI